MKMMLSNRSCSSSLACTSRRHHARIAPRVLIRTQSAQETSTVTSTASSDQIPAGCSRYTVKLKKPLGIELEQDKQTQVIKVVAINPEGSAARSGMVNVGDQLIATSGVTYDRVDDYGGAEVRMGQQVVRMTVQGESFKTVAAAIKSHPGHMPVTLEFQKCETSSS